MTAFNKLALLCVASRVADATRHTMAIRWAMHGYLSCHDGLGDGLLDLVDNHLEELEKIKERLGEIVDRECHHSSGA